MKEYNKIQTIFKRDERNVIIPGDFTLPEFSTLKDLKWDCTEKVDGTNMSVHIIPKPYIVEDEAPDSETKYEYEIEYHGKTADADDHHQQGHAGTGRGVPPGEAGHCFGPW